VDGAGDRDLAAGSLGLGSLAASSEVHACEAPEDPGVASRDA
jgi:hypothetical protein